MKKDKAAKVVASAGLELGVIAETYSAKVAKGRIISQIPASSKGITRASVVMVIISKGKPARLTFGKLAFSRRDIDVGGETVVSVKLSNSGDAQGHWNVVITQDGKVTQTKSVAVAEHGSIVTEFPITSQQPGVHRLRVRGGPAGSYIVRQWVAITTLSGHKTAVKDGRYNHVRSPFFTLTDNADLKLTWTISRHLGGSIVVSVLPRDKGWSLYDAQSSSYDDHGSQYLTRDPGEYHLDVGHANCEWTVTLWVKR